MIYMCNSEGQNFLIITFKVKISRMKEENMSFSGTSCFCVGVDVSVLYGLWVYSGVCNRCVVVYSTQPEGPAQKEEALHLSETRLTGSERT